MYFSSDRKVFLVNFMKFQNCDIMYCFCRLSRHRLCIWRNRSWKNLHIIFFQIFLVILSNMGHLCNICKKDDRLFTTHYLINSILQAFTPPSLHMAQQELEKHSQWWELQSILVAWPELSMSYLKLWIKPRQNSSSKVLMSSLVFSLREHSYMTSDFWVGRQVKPHLILLNKLM